MIAVSDWERSNTFSRDVLGAEVDFQGLNAARHVEPGNSDLCFVWPGPIEEAVEHLERQGAQVEHGSIETTSADRET